jgi:hypothetical protein
MFDLLRRAMYPMFSIGDDSAGGSDDAPKDPPVDNPDNVDSPTPPADDKEEVVDESEISDEDYNATMEKMSPRQLAAMNKRMRDKIAKLSEKPPTPPEPKKEEPIKKEATVEEFDVDKFDRIGMVTANKHGKKAMETILESGLTEKQFSALVDVINIVSAGNSQHFAKSAVQPFANKFIEGEFKVEFAAFSKDDVRMSNPALKKDVEAIIRAEVPPEHWTDREVMKRALGKVLVDHPEYSVAPSKREIVEDGSLHEKTSGGGASGGVSNSSLETFAKERGLGDIKDPTVRKHVLEAFNAKRKIEADLKK